MLLTKEQLASFKEASRPLMKWLNENCHQHTAVIVDCGSAELYEGVARVRVPADI